MTKLQRRTQLLVFLCLFGFSCATPQERATLEVKAQIAADLSALSAAARALQSAAPNPDSDGWDETRDAASVERMRAAWRDARAAYERIEGAIAVLFPEIDTSIDARYDQFLSERGDNDLFDGEGVTGMHAIERILWSRQIPAHVRRFESGLPNGPQEARTPGNEAEARRFREGLVARLVTDCETMERQFRPLALDNATAFRGVIGSLEEQLEKVEKAASSEEESRYAQSTLADMRANLAGGRRTFVAFRPWLENSGQSALATQIEARFDALQNRYAMFSGDAIPSVPEGFNPSMPSAEQLATPYGQLRVALHNESDPMRSDSLVALMNRAADAMRIPQLP